MKILHVCSSDDGGAGIAMRRLHKALLSGGIDSSCLVFRKNFEDPQVQSILRRSIISYYERAGHAITRRVLGAMGFVGRSIAVWPTTALRKINASDADVIHLHWVNAEMISIAQLAKIKKPVVWTFHDMWPFSGAEHYTTSTRYISGYQKSEFSVERSDGVGSNPMHQVQRPLFSCFDLDRWVFNRKQKLWAGWRPTVVTPSRWLSECAGKSALFGSRETHIVPNCIDLDIFKPKDSAGARRHFGLPLDKKLVLFGACNVHDSRKGGDLLRSALAAIEEKDKVDLVIFGSVNDLPVDGFRVHCIGRILQEKTLSQLYNAVDVMCVPSRQEAFGQTASEPLACGTPVVAFGCTGLLDIIEHKVNGYLAVPFDTGDFARGIDWVFRASREDSVRLKQVCRQTAERLCSPGSIVAAYHHVYKRLKDASDS